MIGDTNLEDLAGARNYLNLNRSDLTVCRGRQRLCIARQIQLLAVVCLDMAHNQDEKQDEAACNANDVEKLFLLHVFLLSSTCKMEV